jgi:hypothetical protein
MLNVRWVDHGRKAQCPPDPRYPDGVDVKIPSDGSAICGTALPYPAPQCGVWMIECDVCGQTAAVTAAGRPDDPRSVSLPCGAKPGATGDYPEGKLNPDDEGGLNIAISTEGGDVRIDFGKKILWLALNPDETLALASDLVRRALELKNAKPT